MEMDALFAVHASISLHKTYIESCHASLSVYYLFIIPPSYLEDVSNELKSDKLILEKEIIV